VDAVRTSYAGALANMESGLTPTKNIPGYTVVDLNLGYSVGKWSMQLNAHNVFDRHYYINNYQTLFYGNVVGAPANVALSVRRQF
jgi:outer membrane receptor for ferric coprogen and ferric-rhodotorulic acid